jgi:hypothetical protein
MACSRGGGEKTSLSICKEGGRNAVDLEPLCPLFLLASTLLTKSYLTLPFPLSRDAESELPASPEVELPSADAQIRIPASRSTVPTLVELAVVHRAAPSPPRRRGRSLGEPPRCPCEP